MLALQPTFPAPQTGEGQRACAPCSQGCVSLCAATATALPRQTKLVVVVFLSACTAHSLFILMAISLNFPQIFQSSSVNNMARTKVSPSDGVFPWQVPAEPGPCCPCPSAMQQWGDKACIHLPLTLTTEHSCSPSFSHCLKVSPFFNIWVGVGERMIHPRCISRIFQMKSLFTSFTVSKS